MGIILMGLGLAILGRSADQPGWVVLGLAGCLLHVWNHSLFKSLLFLSAGVERRLVWIRRFQQGITQHYLLYILIAVILMMSTMIFWKAFLIQLFAR